MGIIGCLTALIGDLASSFGCTVGLKDSVTAISFVALGTSLPGNYQKFINFTYSKIDMVLIIVINIHE